MFFDIDGDGIVIGYWLSVIRVGGLLRRASRLPRRSH